MFVKNEDGLLVNLEGVERRVLAHGGKLMGVEFRFKKGAIGALHSHPHEQIGYIASGSFEVTMDGKIEILKAGDTYYVPPNVEHGVVALEDSVVFDAFTPHREDFL